MSVGNERRPELRDERRCDLRGLSAFELRSDMKGMSTHTERRSDLRRMSAHTERRSGLRRVSAHTERRSGLRRVSTHTERRSDLRGVSAHTERRSELRGVSAHTELRSELKRLSAHTERRSDLRRRLHGSSLELKRRGYEQRRCGARLQRSWHRHRTFDARCSLQILWSVLYKRRRQRGESERREQEPRLWALCRIC